jgi:hypothetical protein
MFANGCVDNTAVEQDLGSIGDGIENPQGFLELLVVIVPKRLDPRLYFLRRVREGHSHGTVRHTCLSDMASRQA